MIMFDFFAIKYTKFYLFDFSLWVEIFESSDIIIKKRFTEAR